MAANPTPEWILEQLVGFDTTSHRSTHEIVEFIANLVDRPGVEILREPDPTGEKENVVIRMGPEVDPGSRDGLVLSGHLDVVPADEPEWQSDPFELTDGEENWVARGSADMKGFLALALARFLATDPASLTSPLVLLLTRDEELGCRGSDYFVQHLGTEVELPRRTVIGEPTSLRVVRLHKGHMRLDLQVSGVSAHSGYPHRGKNAIEAAGKAITALVELRTQMETERSPNSDHFPSVPFVALNLAMIQGGRAVNVIPDSCELKIGMRPLPSTRPQDQPEALVERVRERIAATLEPGTWKLELDHSSPPLLTPEDSTTYRDLCALVSQKETTGVAFASDAGSLQELGMDCVLFGPGSIEVAHKPNEYLPKKEFYSAAKTLEQLVARSCLSRS